MPIVSPNQIGVCQVRNSPDDSLGILARAKTLVELERLWKSDPKDFPHRAIHAERYFKLNGANRDDTLLNAMPSNGEEMKALYDAQDTQQGHDMVVTNAYNGYYSALAEIIIRHPEHLPQFLRMIHAFHFIDNVDEWPQLCGLASKAYKAHPKHYLNSVRKLEPEFRQEALACRNPPDVP